MTIKEYWNLIGREPFLTITWESGFSQACSFHRMLMKLKNFHLTQIPDKTNDMIFLKSPKILFWVIFYHFWSFLPNRDVFQKIQLSHIIIDEPLTACWFSEKNNEPIPRKLRYRWKDERKDRHTLIFRTIMVAVPPNFRGGGAEQKTKFGGELNLRGGLWTPVMPWL